MDTSASSRRRFVAGLLDHADHNRGCFPKTRRLSDYSQAECREILLALKRRHYRLEGGVPVVKIEDYVRDEFAGPAEFRQAMCKALGRKPLDLAAKEEEETQHLLGVLQAAGLESNTLQDQIQRQRGWIGRSLRAEGFERTLQRLQAYCSFIQGLSRVQGDVPLKTYVGDVLGNSHALDNDGLLRGAVEAYVEAQVPDAEDLDDAYKALGIVRRVQNQGATWHGPLVLQVDGLQLDFTGLAAKRLPASLPEATLAAASSVDTPPWALFVEGPATWHELGRRDWTGPVILTDGMPNHATRLLCRLLAHTTTRIYHWGDVDPGGYRVLGCLQEHGPVQPIFMDEVTVHMNRNRLTTPSERKMCLMEESRHPAVKACAAFGGFLEQERIHGEAIPELVKLLGGITL